MTHISWQTGLPCDCGFDRVQPSLDFGVHHHLASWEKGTWAQGLFFPSTGYVEIWPDDRTHQEVEKDDELASQGRGIRFTVRPNGTVQADNPPEELQQALKDLDPSLKVDSPEWDLKGLGGPTEPVPEYPESEDEGRKHNVQIRDDYMGPT